MTKIFKRFRWEDWAFLAFMFFVLLYSAAADAQALPSSPHPASGNANTWTYSGGSTTSANAGSVAFPPPANGSVYSESTQTQPVGGGKTVPIVVKSRPSPASIAKAVGTFAAKIYTPLAVGAALWDLCIELGFSCSVPSGKALEVNKTTSGCSAAPIEDYMGLCGSDVPRVEPYRSAELGNACYAKVFCPNPDRLVNATAGARETSPVSSPSSVQELADAIAAKSGWPSNSAIAKVLPEAISSGVPLELPAPYEITGPANVPMVPTVTTWPDGTKVTDTQQKEMSYGPNTVTVTDKSVKTQTSPQGVTTPVSTVTSPAALPQPAAETEKPKDPCGLPDTPLCAVDGAGTPTGETLPEDGAAKTLKTIDDFLKDPSTVAPKLPTINWAFSLPSACGVIPTPAFAPYMEGIDVCKYQGMFHEIMSMVWMLGGLFGAISLFMRSSLAD